MRVGVWVHVCHDAPAVVGGQLQELVPFYHGFLTESSADPSLECTEGGQLLSLPEAERVQSVCGACAWCWLSQL